MEVFRNVLYWKNEMEEVSTSNFVQCGLIHVVTNRPQFIIIIIINNDDDRIIAIMIIDLIERIPV